MSFDTSSPFAHESKLLTKSAFWLVKFDPIILEWQILYSFATLSAIVGACD